MSANLTPNSSQDKEVDLSQVSKSIGLFFDRIAIKIFHFILFLKRNLIILLVLIILGVVSGYFIDKNNKIYESEIVVKPNFQSVDYLYDKIDLIQSKIKENDTLFLKNQVGIAHPKKFLKISIDPVNDIYGFVKNQESNFEMIKLMAENSDMKKIMEDETTSKNFLYHKITVVTAENVNEETLSKPLLDFLENSDYLRKVAAEYVNNAQIKLKENDSIIEQINGLLKSFANAGDSKSSSVYINQNTQINDIIKTKETFIIEKGYLRIELLNYDKIFKKVSSNLSKRDTSFLANNNKILLPLLFILLFCLVISARRFYKKQVALSKESV
jgi:uncharacterized membrane protein